jgi:hypothetical protein
LNDFAGAPKSASGQIVKEGKDPIDFNVKFDSKRRIKEVQAEQIILLDDGAKEKLISRELEPEYDKETGAYVRITTPHAESFLNTSYGMNYVDDPLLDMTMGKAKDITKSAGFLGGKTSDETVQLKVDLEGVIYFTGRSNYFKANATFQEMLDANGIVPKRKNTVTNFVTRANINEKGILEEWSWDGSVTTSFGTSMNPSNQEIVADKMLRSIKALESDEHGNPLKIDYNFAMQGKLNVTQKMSVKEWFVKSYEQGSAPRADVSSDGFSFEGKAIWNCTFKYDEQGNWTEMKMGPYTATRTFKY